MFYNVFISHCRYVSCGGGSAIFQFVCAIVHYFLLTGFQEHLISMVLALDYRRG